MKAPVSPRVLIKTQPLGHNYGGLLQAYALQRTVQSLGVAADTDGGGAPTLRSRLGRIYFAVKPRLFARPLFMREVEMLANAALLEFAQRHIDCADLYRFGSRPSRRELDRYSLFIAGSDQIWRPSYSDVPASLFSFVPVNSKAHLISYAASFGVDDLSEFSAGLREQTKRLAARFEAVSVREASGRRLALELWGRDDAVQHVDPTLLLDSAHYGALVDSAKSVDGLPKPGGVVSYILDRGPSHEAVEKSITSRVGSQVEPLLRREAASIADYLTEPDRYRKISVEAWLSSIRDAHFVLTDSFHGCVFSMIFNTPFAYMPNSSRGATRFESLSEQFGIADRELSVEPVSSLDSRIERLMLGEIDWTRIEARVNDERVKALKYLAKHLGRLGVDGGRNL